MEWSLIIFVIVVALFAYRGYRNGLLKSVGRILSIVAGYVCAILYTGPASGIVGSQLQLEGIAAFIVTSLILFIGASVAVSLVFWLSIKMLSDGQESTTASAVGGAAVGVVTGVLVAIIVVWAYAFVRDIRPQQAPVAASEPPAIEKFANRIASRAVSSAMSAGEVNPEIKSISAALFEAPADIVQQAQRLAQSEDLQRLLTDPRNQQVLDSGDYAAVRQLPDFQQLARNRDLQDFMDKTRMLENAVAKEQNLEQALAQQLTDVWVRTQRVKNDPRVQNILNDTQFQQKLRSGNPIDLLTNQKLLELTDLIFADEAAPTAGATGSPSAGPALENSQQNGGKKKKIYTWTDEDGKLHISDVDPNS